VAEIIDKSYMFEIQLTLCSMWDWCCEYWQHVTVIIFHILCIEIYTNSVPWQYLEIYILSELPPMDKLMFWSSYSGNNI